MKIGIVQVYDKNIEEYAQYSRIINSIYAIMHQYTYISWNYDLVPPSCSVYYNKIIAIHKAFEQYDCDWFLYLDADAIITNSTYTIEEIIERHPEKEIIFGADRNGLDGGVILIKNTSNMMSLLQEVFNDRRFFHTKTPEQTSLITLINEKYVELGALEPAWFFSGYLNYYADYQHKSEPLWNKDSFILHVSCMKGKERAKVFQKFLQQNNIHYITSEDE